MFTERFDDFSDAGSTMGSRARSLRLKAGLTQVQLAARAGIRQSLISEIEKGVATKPGAVALNKLCTALGTNVRWLLEGVGSPGSVDAALDMVEAEALKMIRELDPAGRARWIRLGRALLDEQTNGTLGEPYVPVGRLNTPRKNR